MPADAEDVARRSAAAMWVHDRASQQLGMQLEEVGPGRAVLSMAVTEAMVNGHDICHGGMVFALADSAFAFACNSHGDRTVAQGADITFLAPARLGDVLVATAVERRRIGRNGLTDVTVVDLETKEAIAEFRGRSRQIEGRLVD